MGKNIQGGIKGGISGIKGGITCCQTRLQYLSWTYEQNRKKRLKDKSNAAEAHKALTAQAADVTILPKRDAEECFRRLIQRITETDDSLPIDSLEIELSSSKSCSKFANKSSHSTQEFNANPFTLILLLIVGIVALIFGHESKGKQNKKISTSE